MLIVTLSEEEFDNYALKHKYANYYQTSSYGKTMSQNGFDIHYIGIKNELDDLVGASLIVCKTVFMGKKIAYAPRGILFDYNNPEVVVELVKKLKQVFGKQGFLILRMDPYIPATVRHKSGKILNINREVNETMINLKNAGFKYKGKNNYFENELPRFEAIKLLNDNIDVIYRGLSKRVRHKIRRALGCGISIFKDNGKNVDYLYEMCKDKTGLSKKFLQDMAINFRGSDIYYALLNTDSFVIDAKKRYEAELDKNSKLSYRVQNSMKEKNTHLLNAKMESDRLIAIYKNDLIMATDLLKRFPKGLVIAGALTIDFNNEKYLIIDGFSKNYSHLNALYLLKWFIIDDAKKHNMKFFNMNAITGDFKNTPFKSLNDSKLDFNTIPTEYIGEFDLVLNNFDYVIYKGLSKDKNYQLKDNISTENK